MAFRLASEIPVLPRLGILGNDKCSAGFSVITLRSNSHLKKNLQARTEPCKVSVDSFPSANGWLLWLPHRLERISRPANQSSRSASITEMMGVSDPRVFTRSISFVRYHLAVVLDFPPTPTYRKVCKA